MTERTYIRHEIEGELARRIAVRVAHGQERATARKLVAAELLLEDGLAGLGPAATPGHAAAALDRLVDALAILVDTVPGAGAFVSERGYQVVRVGSGALRTTERADTASAADDA